jgi:hypothetical protein
MYGGNLSDLRPMTEDAARRWVQRLLGQARGATTSSIAKHMTIGVCFGAIVTWDCQLRKSRNLICLAGLVQQRNAFDNDVSNTIRVRLIRKHTKNDICFQNETFYFSVLFAGHGRSLSWCDTILR